MVRNSKKDSSILFFVSILITASLACNYSGFAQDLAGEPIAQLPTATSKFDLTDEKEAEYQAYMGSVQSELISVEPVPFHEDCPPDDVDLSPDGVVNHVITGNTLIATDSMGSREYSYSSTVDGFCRDVLPKGSGECISFYSADGQKFYNLRRYRHEGSDFADSLCYDQYNRIQIETEGSSASDPDAVHFDQCLASPDMYQVEFANINRLSNSPASKQVCDGDFIFRNLSEVDLWFRYYYISDNGAMHSEWWSGSNLGPGESLEDYFGTQTYSDGRSTLNTFVKLIVGLSTQACGGFQAVENEALWDASAITLDDPCN